MFQARLAELPDFCRRARFSIVSRAVARIVTVENPNSDATSNCFISPAGSKPLAWGMGTPYRPRTQPHKGIAVPRTELPQSARQA